MAGLIGTRSVVQARVVRPAMIETLVETRSQGRRLAIDAASPPPESAGAERGGAWGFARVCRRSGNPLRIASVWTSIRGTSEGTTDIRMGDRSDGSGSAGSRNQAEMGRISRPFVPPSLLAIQRVP